MIPIKLYELDGKAVKEVENDLRVKLLNDETGDTLDSAQFWRAIIADYYLGRGGYAFINRRSNQVASLHYVESEKVSIVKNTDPIFKDYDIQIDGKPYKPYEFIKILRNTKDGASGNSIIDDNYLLLSVAYQTMIFEEVLVKKGGNKKGFLKSEKVIDDASMTRLKSAWQSLYSNNSENVLILNNGIDFKEASMSSVELQLNENKETNSAEVCKLFNVPSNIINGTGTREEYKNAFDLCVKPLLKVIVAALNRDMLLESEKGTRYFAHDTKELLKGDLKERFEAYKVGIDGNFLGIDEVRYMEDLPEYGLNWIKLGLDSVLYDVKTGKIYTPNTGKIDDLNASSLTEADTNEEITIAEGGEEDESGDKS
jgi:HK97 family phage portal protein